MQINNYQFGSITIDGKNYSHDVEARSDGEVLPWQRKESHIIDAEDVKGAIEQKPDLIIIGTGESGLAQITEAAKKEIESSGIKFVSEWTDPTTKIFNEESKKGDKKIIGLFHLTC